MAYKNRDDARRYAREHYQRNSQLYKRRARVHTRAMARAVRMFIRGYLATHPCVDCGESDPIVLEFDHRAPALKVFNIGESNSLSKSIKSVRFEVSKCDVRCSNCHRRRTFTQRSSGVFAGRTQNRRLHRTQFDIWERVE